MTNRVPEIMGFSQVELRFSSYFQIVYICLKIFQDVVQRKLYKTLKNNKICPEVGIKVIEKHSSTCF